MKIYLLSLGDIFQKIVISNCIIDFHFIFYKLAEVASYLTVGIFKGEKLVTIPQAVHPFRINRIDLRFDGYKEHRNQVVEREWSLSGSERGADAW